MAWRKARGKQREKKEKKEKKRGRELKKIVVEGGNAVNTRLLMDKPRLLYWSMMGEKERIA